MVIPNAINSKKFNTKLNNNSIILEDFFVKAPIKIINIGRFDDNKNQEYLIRIFIDLKKYIPNAKLFLFGEGERKNNLIKWVKSLSLDKDIFFMGWKSNIEEYIKRADLLIHTSKYESFGNIIIEALACGTPVLTSAYGLVLCQIKDVINNCKFLQTCYVEDEKCFLTKALKILKTRPSVEEKISISKIVQEYFSIEKISQNYLNILKQCAE